MADYSDIYKGANPLEQQIEKLRRTWPQITPGKHLASLERKLPIAEGEGYFAVIRHETLAPTLADALEKELFPAIAAERIFENRLAGRLGDAFLREEHWMLRMLNVYAEGQKGDIIVLQAALGLRYRGKSPLLVRQSCRQNKIEIPLDAFLLGMMLYTTPLRFTSKDDLSLDCPGSSYAFAHHTESRFVPHYEFDGTKISFGVGPLKLADPTSGSATAFLV